MEKRHFFWLDCLKIFAAFLIVLQHSISYEWVRLLGEVDITWKIINLLFILSKAGVPIFIMCSGMGMLQRERSIKEIFTKSIFDILKIYACWMLLYGAYDVYGLFVSDTATVRTVINAFAKNILFGEYHTWYIATLVGLYLITPFLYLIAKNKVLMRYFLVLAFVFTIVLPYVDRFGALDRVSVVIHDVNMNFLVGYPLYFVLGYYLSQVTFTKAKKILVGVVWAVSLVAAFVLSSQSAVENGSNCQAIFTDFSVFGFLLSVSTVLLFKAIFDREPSQTIVIKVVKTLSYCGIGIYLLHPLLLPLVENLKGLSCLAGGVLLWILVATINIVISMLPIRSLFLGKKKGK